MTIQFTHFTIYQQEMMMNRPQNKNTRSFFVIGILALIGTIGVAVTRSEERNSAPQRVLTESSDPFLDLEMDKKGHLMFNVPLTSLNVPFIIHSTFNKGAAPLGKVTDNKERAIPARDQENQVFHFELAENGNQLYLVREDYVTRTNDEELEYALKEGLWTGYVDILDIVSKSDRSYEISATSLLENGFYVSTYVSGTPRVLQHDTRAFQDNTNVLVQYDDNRSSTYSLFFSLMRLPQVPMKARVADDRVGYFAIRYNDLGMSKSSAFRQTDDIDRTVTIINRRRLEKNDKGETMNPITYYIDPSVPKRWRLYFKQGVEIWKDAFAKAGFQNAIRAVLPSDCDFPTDYHMGDMRYNSISVMMSNRVYARGPSVVDPRSGEILHSDIAFAHGWVKSWVGGIENQSPFIPNDKKTKTGSQFQCFRADSDEEKLQATFFNAYAKYAMGQVSDSAIGSAFRETVMHEVGHTLGLRHNFIASMARTEEQLMDSEYTKKHGTTASVMDYVPSNIWSSMTRDQANHHVFFTTVLGEYDYAAIKYGYKQVLDEIPTYKSAGLDQLARSTPDFATDEDKNTEQNPYAMTFDMAKDPIGYFLDRMALINVLRSNMLERSVFEGESWTKLWSTESFFLRYTNYIVRNLARFIGGVKVQHEHRYDHALTPVVEFVSKKDHLRVLNFTCQVISNNKGIFPHPSTYSMYFEQSGVCEPGMSSYCYANQVADVDSVVQKVRMDAISHVLDVKIIQKLVMEENQAHMTVHELFSIVQEAVFVNPTDFNNFNVQSHFIAQLKTLADVPEQRIATQAKMALIKSQDMIQQFKKDKNDLPVEVSIHFDNL